MARKIARTWNLRGATSAQRMAQYLIGVDVSIEADTSTDTNIMMLGWVSGVLGRVSRWADD